MITLNYNIDIKSSKKIIWEHLLQKEKYDIWAKGFSKDSTFIGEIKYRNYVKFLDKNVGGTQAYIIKCEIEKELEYFHIFLIDKNWKRQEENEFIKKWLWTTKNYKLLAKKNFTRFNVTVNTDKFLKLCLMICFLKH